VVVPFVDAVWLAVRDASSEGARIAEQRRLGFFELSKDHSYRRIIFRSSGKCNKRGNRFAKLAI
jgi:hypothetical protein